MIIQFSVENYLSFKDLTTLSMVAAKSFKEHPDTHLIAADYELSLLKSAAIYGNNASGKSNLLEAIGFMKETVLTSFRDALLETSEKKFPLEKFALSTKTEGESSFFEMIFIHKENKYRYGFEIDYDKIVTEWLFRTAGKEVKLFTRDLQNIKVNKTSFKEGIGKEEDVRENVLFLSLLATLGKDISSGIIDWFKKVSFINVMDNAGHRDLTINYLKIDKEFLNWALKFVKYLEIDNISIVEIDLLADFRRSVDSSLDNYKSAVTYNHSVPSCNIKLEDYIAKNFYPINNSKFNFSKAKEDYLITYHRRYDENSLLVDTIPFNFEKQESEGTKKLLYMLGPWYDAIRNNKILIVDELDSKLHSRLTQKLIEFFNSASESQAQLVCAVHDISILNKETFRRDQIWFMDKNQFGASELVSLGDFRTDTVRNSSAFDKAYLEGKYGAIPYFENSEKLKKDLHGKGR